MYKYKVLALTRVKDCEEKINEYAKDGWRVISLLNDRFKGAGLIVTMERSAR